MMEVYYNSTETEMLNNETEYIMNVTEKDFAVIQGEQSPSQQYGIGLIIGLFAGVIVLAFCFVTMLFVCNYYSQIRQQKKREQGML